MSFSAHDRVSAEADAWRRLRREGGADEAEFQAWLAASDENRRAYAEVERIFALLSEGHRRGELLRASAVTSTAWRRPALRVAAACAASFLLLGSIAAAVLVMRSGRIETAAGETRSVLLEDQSRVYLSGGTKLTVRMTDSERLVELRDGEALFEVAKDPSRPFRVDAGTQIVQAVGTAFDVSRIGGTVEIAVGEGVVNVVAAGATPAHVEPAVVTTPAMTLLHAGQAIAFDGKVSRKGVRPIDRERVGAWRQGSLVFESVTFAQMLDVLGRHYGGRFTVEDPALAGRVISMPINAQSRAEIVQLVELSMKVRAIQNGNDVRFVR